MLFSLLICLFFFVWFQNLEWRLLPSFGLAAPRRDEILFQYHFFSVLTLLVSLLQVIWREEDGKLKSVSIKGPGRYQTKKVSINFDCYFLFLIVDHFFYFLFDFQKLEGRFGSLVTWLSSRQLDLIPTSITFHTHALDFLFYSTNGSMKNLQNKNVSDDWRRIKQLANKLGEHFLVFLLPIVISSLLTCDHFCEFIVWSEPRKKTSIIHDWPESMYETEFKILFFVPMLLTPSFFSNICLLETTEGRK